MSPLVRLLWKEAREVLRPRYLLPLLLVPAMFVAMGQGFAGIGGELADRPAVGLANADDGPLGAAAEAGIREEADVVYERDSVPADPRAAAETVAEEGGAALLVVPPDFTERIRSGERATVRVYTVVGTVSFVGVASSAEVSSVLAAGERRVTLAATNATNATLDPATPEHVTYVDGRRVAAPPSSLSAALSGQVLVPVVVTFVVVFAGQIVLASMGAEKEHATLETLLSMPVARWKIVAAKLAAGVAVALVAAVLFTGAVAFYQSALSATAPGGGSFGLSVGEYALLGVSLALALTCVLALALCLGVLADDQQGAQFLLLPLSLLALPPMFVTLFTEFAALPPLAQVGLFLLPLTHPIIAPKQLLFGDAWLVVAGVGYELVFTVGAVWLAGRLFASDRIVVGLTGRLGTLIDRLQR